MNPGNLLVSFGAYMRQYIYIYIWIQSRQSNDDVPDSCTDGRDTSQDGVWCEQLLRSRVRTSAEICFLGTLVIRSILRYRTCYLSYTGMLWAVTYDAGKLTPRL